MLGVRKGGLPPLVGITLRFVRKHPHKGSEKMRERMEAATSSPLNESNERLLIQGIQPEQNEQRVKGKRVLL